MKNIRQSKQKKLTGLTLLIVFLFAGIFQASGIDFSATINSNQKFNKPNQGARVCGDATYGTFTSVSAGSVQFCYATQAFTPSSSGNYTITVTSSTASDPMLYVYTSFSVSNPTAGFKVGDDDSGDGLLSKIDCQNYFNGGQSYVIVVTTYSSSTTSGTVYFSVSGNDPVVVLPTVTTSTASGSGTTYTLGGNVTADGGATVTSRGVAYGTSSNPTSGVAIGSGTGSFSTSVTLNSGTTYYYRAYATNSVGTAYGVQYTLTTPSLSLPTVSTTTASSITINSASSGGNVTADGGASVTAKGLVWNTSGSPTISSYTGITSNGSGTGSFSSSLSSLTNNTTYYYRAYATNSVGTAYGTQYSFITLPTDPTSPSATPSTICNGQGSALSVANAQGTVNWYTGGCGVSYVGSGNPLNVYPSASTTYYARNSNASGSSTGCVSVTVNVNQPSTAPSGSTVTVPAGSGGLTGANLSWGTSSGTTPITYYWAVGTGSGVTYESGYTARGTTSHPTVTASATGLSQSTTYYLAVKSSNTCGTSAYNTSSSFRTNHVLTYNAGANGTLSGTTSQIVSNGGNGSSVTAVPNTNYHFVNWSDGSTSNPRTDLNVTNSLTVTANFALNHLEFSTQPSSTIAGQNIPFTVTIKDSYGNVMSNSDQDITLSIVNNPGGGTLSGNLVLHTVNGVVSSANTWIDKVGSGYTLRATASPLTAATSSLFNITPAAIDHFTVTGITDPVVAGTTTTPTVTAYDVFDNVKTNYTGTIVFTSDDNYPAVLPANYTFLAGDQGVKSFTNGVILKRTGERTVTVTGDGKTGSQTDITVTPAAINYFTLIANGPVVAGTEFTVTATVYDEFNNIKTNYVGDNSVMWMTTATSSNNGTARIIPENGDQNFTLGVATIGGFTFYNSHETPTITITDGPTASPGTTDPITVYNAPLDNFKVEAGTTQTSGIPFDVTVTARDVYWNTCIDYTGSIRFKSSDDNLVDFPEGLQPFTGYSGVRTFINGININTVGAYWLRAADATYAYKSGDQQNIVVYPGGFSSNTSNSTLTISDPLTPANFVDPLNRIAGEYVFVTATPRDAQGNLLYACRDISILLNGSASDYDGPIAVTNVGDGTYTALVRVTLTGNNIISARFNDNDPDEIFQQTRTAIVGPAPVSLANTLITADPIVMTTDESSLITVQLKDQFNNNRVTSDGVIELTTSRGVLTSVSDNNDGTYNATLYGNYGAVGIAHITGILTGNISGSITDSEDVTINEGLPALSTIEITANPEIITTNETSLISVQLKDQFGNLVTTNRGTVALSSTLGTLTAVSYTSGGIYQATLSGWNPGFGPSTVTGQFDGGNIADNAIVYFNEGLPDLTKITISATPETMTSDESIAITVQLKDAFGNNLTTSRGTVALTSTRGSLSVVVDNLDGTYTATLTGDNRGFGISTITGTLTGDISGDISDNAVVTITEGVPNLSQITITSLDESITTDESTLITVQLKDQWGNNLSTERGTISLSTTVGSLTSAIYAGSGAYTSVLSTTITGTATITGSLDDPADLVTGAIMDDAVVTINEGKPALATIQITAWPETITTDESSTITVQLKDQWGNNLSTERGTVTLASTKGLMGTATYQTGGYYTATLTGDNRGTGLATITGILSDPADGVTGDIADNAFVNFTEGLPNLAVSSITVNNATMTTDGNSTVTVQLADQWGNLIENNRGDVSLVSTIGELSAVTYAGNGQYTSLLTGDTRGVNGTGLSTITGSFTGSGSASSVTGPFTDDATVSITEGLPSLLTTEITANPVTMTTDESSLISVQLKDWLGNLITHDRATVTLSTTLGVLGNSLASYSGNGIYTATLYGNNTGTGLATITGVLSGIVQGPLTDGIFDDAEVLITEGAPSMVTSLISASPSSITTDETSTITVQLKDQFGNLLTTSRGTVELSTTLGAVGIVTDNLDGTYTAYLTGNNSGVGIATISGTLNGFSFNDSENVTITEGLPNLAQSSITSSPSTMTTDETSTITVRLKDQWGNLIIHSRGDVALFTDLGVLSSVTDHNDGTYTATLSANNTGTGTATITGSFTGTGSASAVNGPFSDNTTVLITEGLPVLAQIQITADPVAITADETSLITIRLKDQHGNNLTQSRGTVTLATNPIGALSAVTDNMDGTYSATFFLNAFGTGTATITGNFAGTGTASGVNGAITDNATVQVSHGVATKLTILTQPSATATAGVVFAQQPVIRIEDQFSNLVTADDATIVTAAVATGTDILKGTLTATAIDGIATFSGLFYTKAETITLGFSSAPALATATSTNIVVGHAPVDHFALNAPANITAGASRAGYVVTRYDFFNNLVTTGPQTVYLFSSSTGVNKKFFNASSGGTVITQLTIPNGVSTGSFWYYDEKTGDHTITVSDATPADGTAGIDDASDVITVNPAILKDFLVYGVPDPHDLGTWQSVTVEARDTYNNRKTNYVGRVTFSSTDVSASVPSDYQYTTGDMGIHVFTGLLKFSQPGSWWITALDWNEPQKYGAQANIVVQRAVSIVANNRVKTYGETLNLGTTEFTITGIVPGVNPVPGEITGVTLTSTGAAATASVAGSPYVIYTSNATGPYNPAYYRIVYSNEGLLTINTRLLTLSNFLASSKTYDGTTDVTGTGFSDDRVNNDELTFSYTASFEDKHAETGKTVNYTGIAISGGAGASNYVLASTTGTATADIYTRALNVTAVTDTKIYDGTISSDEIPSVDALQVGDQVSNPGTQVFDTKHTGTGKTMTASGTVIDDGNGGNNYTISYLTNNSGSITKAGVNVYAMTDTKVYDGNTTSDEVPEVTGIIEPDDIANAPTQSYIDRHAGTGKTLIPQGLTINDGNSGNNYQISYHNDLTGEITPAAVTVTAQSSTKVYDGNTSSSAIPEVSGIIPPDDIQSTPIQEYETKHAGTGKTMIASGLVINDGNSGNNYQVSYVPDFTGVITTAAVTVIAQTDEKTYDGTVLSDSEPVILGIISPDAVAVAPVQAYDNRNAGNGKTMTASGLVIDDGNGGDNYHIDYYTDETGKINKAQADVYAVTDSKVYDGNALSGAEPQVTGIILPDAPQVLPTQVYDNRNVGTGKTMTASGLVIDDGNSGNNYQVSYHTDPSGTITSAGVTVYAQTDTKVYDGNTSSGAIPQVVGIIEPDAVLNSPSQSYDTKHAGTGKVMTAAGLTINDGNNGDNYSISYVTDETGVITKAGATVTAQPDSKIYDGTTSSDEVPVVTGLIGADAIGTNPVQEYDTKHAGTGKTMIPSGLVISDGNGGNNYEVNYINDLFGVISVRSLNVTAQTDTKVYDGNTASVVLPVVDALQTGDAVTDPGIQTFDTKHVGTEKVLTPEATVISDGNGGANYAISYITDNTGVITQKGVTVNAVADAKIYDGDNSSDGEPVIGPLAVGESVLNAPSQVFDNKHVGSGKVMTADGLSIQDAGSNDVTSNYLVTYLTNSEGIISQRAISVTAQTDTKVYDGNTASVVLPVVDDLQTGDVLTDPGIQTFDTKHVGTEKVLTPEATVISDGNGGANYAISYITDNTGVITQKGVTVNAVADAKIYDGDNSSDGEPVIGPLAVGESVLNAPSQVFDNKHVGSGKVMTADGLSIQDAGSNDVTSNYLVTYLTNSEGIISQRAISVTAQTDTKVYDGNTASVVLPVVDALQTGDVLTDPGIQTFDTKHVGTEKVLTPEATVISDGNGGANYAISYITDNTGVITQKGVTVNAVADAKIYDGDNSSDGEPVIGPLAVGESVLNAPSQVFDNKHVGSGKVMTADGLSIQDAGSNDVTSNYLVTYLTNSEGIISQRAISVTAQTDTKVYDGNTASVVLPVVDALQTGDVLTDPGIQTFDTKHVGTEKVLTPEATVISDGNGGANYAISYITDNTGVITQKGVTVNAVADAKIYDGDNSSDGEPVIGPLAVGESVLNAPSQVFDNKHVGSGKVMTADGLTIQDAGSNDVTSNYLVTYLTNSEGIISQRAISVTAQTDTKVYDGNTASVVLPVVDALQTGDVLTDPGIQTFDTKHVGTEKVLTPEATVISDGNGGDNYAISYITDNTGVITQKGVTVNAVADAKIYDGDNSSNGEPVVGPLAVGESVLNAPSQVFDNKHVGSGKVMTADGLTIQDAGSNDVTSNYLVTYLTNNEGIISQRAISVTAQTDTKVYDGNTSSVVLPVVDALQTGDAVTDPGIQTFDTKHVGTEKVLTPEATVISDGNGGANYAISYITDNTGVITQKGVTVNAVADAKIYDGDNSSDGEPVVGPLAVGESVLNAPSQVFDNKHVGSGKVMTADGLTIQDAGSNDVTSNYLVTYLTNSEGIISQRAISVTAQTDTKVYDGNTASVVLPVVDALQTGDVLTDPGIQTFDTKHVGTEKVLTPEATVISDGNGGDNYAISYITDNTGVITQHGINVTAQPGTKVYDGNTSSSVVPVVDALQPGDDLTSPGVQVYNNKHIGTGKLLTPGSTVIDDGNGGANYSITYITAQSGTITKAPLNVTAQAATKVYDGTVISAIQPSVGLLQPGDAVTNAGMQVYDTKHVGTGKVMTPSGTVINDGNGGNNYQITYVPNSVGIITEKMVYVNAVTDSKVYDGTVASAASPIVIGIISPDYAGTFPTQVFDTEDAGTGKLLTASGMVISDGNGGNNYSVTYFTDNTGVITPKALTITAENKVKCYDGEVYGDGYTVVYSGFVTGEDEGDLNGTLGFTGTAVTAVDPGNYTIIPGGLTSGNYAINYVNGALAINALPAPAISGETAVYVNTTHSYSTPLVADHTYNWEITGGVIQGSQTGHEVTVLWGDTPGTGTLTVNEVITETGCQVTTEAYNVTISEWEYPVFTVNGVFTYYKLSNPLPMDNVTVNLKQGGTVIATTVTNASGFYEFPNIPDGTYSIEASTQKPHGGVNATDAGQVNYWWTHRTPIERVKWNAGNFYSSDNFMNATDAGQIRGYFLNGNPLSSQGYWTFWRQQQSSDANPPAGVSTFAVSGANTTVNYYGLCVGDFNMSYAMPPGMKAAYGNSAVSLVYEEPIMASAGAMVDVPFRVNASMQVGAISMILNYPSELAVIESVVLSDGTLPEGATPVGFSVDGDELRIAWNDLVPLELSESGYLFTVRVRTTDLFTPGHTISFTLVEDPLNELADGQYEPIDNVMLLTRNIEASATGIDEGKEPMVTLEAYPNPFTEKVNIVYSLPAESQVWLEIDNIYGSRIAVLADEIRQPGTHKVNFDGISLNPGIYTVTLKTKANGEIQIRTLKIVRGW